MIAILYICTGKYAIFWRDFFISAEKYFLPSHQKTYFVFTDTEELYGDDRLNVKKIYQKSLGWPFSTLLRFEMFNKINTELKKFDYLFFINANVVIVDKVGIEILPDKTNDGLIGTIHPYFWNKHPNDFTYDRNPDSTAYIQPGAGKHYYFGAFNGGESNAYLKLIATLKKNIEIDLEKNIVALWHDESHLNHYLLDKNPLALSPAYAHPEDYDLPFNAKICILDKLKYGGHHFLRNT